VSSLPVDEYLTALNRSLGGPRRRRADLLAEARDHLTDATEALEAEGLGRYDAERVAVADFGELADVVPGYRAELAVSQGRRTAVMMLMALSIQPIVWLENTWSWDTHPSGESPFNAFLQVLVRGIGYVTIAGAVLAVIATGVGLRYPLIRDNVSRVTGHFTLASSIVISLCGLTMTTFSGHVPTLVDVSVVLGFVVLPLIFVALQAGRCLRLARA
jgi:hypothetical protein